MRDTFGEIIILISVLFAAGGWIGLAIFGWSYLLSLI